MNTAELGGNPYASLAMAALVEVPSNLLVIWLFDKVGKPVSLSVCLLMNAAFFIATVAIPEGINHCKAQKVCTSLHNLSFFFK